MQRITLIIFFTVFVAQVLFAQHSVMNQLNSSNGLSNSALNYIYQDSKGFMWFCTWDGLNKYDGRNFLVFKTNPTDSSSISNNFVKGIQEESPDIYWVVTDHGVNRFFAKENKFKRYYLGYEDNAPIIEDSYSLTINQDVIFCSSYKFGLSFFDKKKAVFVPILIPHHNLFDVSKIYADSFSQLWVLKKSGDLLKLKYNFSGDQMSITQVEKFNTNGSLGHSIFYCDSNNIFLVTRDNQLFSINVHNSDMTTLVLKDYPKTTVPHIKHVFLKNRKLILSSIFYGSDLYNYDEGQIRFTRSIYSANPTTTSYISDQDIMWIGTDGQGVFKNYFNNVAFKLWENSAFDLKTNNANRSFFQDRDSTVYVGTKGSGIYKIKNLYGTKRIVDRISIGDNRVYAIKKGFGNELLVGTDAQGLSIYDLKTAKISSLIPASAMEAFSSVYTIIVDEKRKVLWLGTTGYGMIKIAVDYENGIYRIKSIKKYVADSNNKKSISFNIVSSLKQDGDNIWIGTRGGGLCKFNIESEQFETYKMEPHNLKSISTNDIISLTIDESRNLWIGTGYGLNKLEIDNTSKGFVHFTQADGLINNTVHGVVVDHKKLWLTTNGGVCMIDQRTGKIHNFTSKDGLQSNEFSDGGFYKSDLTGEIFLGGINGFNYFHSEDINLRSYSPPIYIGAFYIFDKEVNYQLLLNPKNNNREKLSLSYDQRFFSFRFLALDYIKSESCEFSYFLEGFTKDWIYNGTDPKFNFTNVPAGTYLLRVKVSNGDKVWSPQEFQMRIDIQSPWWASWYAYLAYAVITAGIFTVVYLLFKNKWKFDNEIALKKIEKLHQEEIHQTKLRFFTNIAHEFSTSLTLIYGPCQKLLEFNTDDLVKKHLHTIKNNTYRMLKLIDELMVFRKIETDHLKLHPERLEVIELVKYLSDNFISVIEEEEITFSINAPAELFWVSDREALDKILFNILSNAVKYVDKKGLIRLDIAIEHAQLCIKVYNTGVGMSNEDIDELFDRFKILKNFENLFSKGRFQRIGVGMALTKGLVDLLGGEISIQSKEREGAQFTVHIPELTLHNNLVQVVHTLERHPEQVPSYLAELDDTLVFDININKTILIVDDEEEISQFIRGLFPSSFNCIGVVNGIEALEKIKYIRPDIIILDIMMPEMDGLSFFKQLRSNTYTSHIPVVFLSSKSDTEDKIVGNNMGVDAYISKPFNPNYLVSVVYRILKNRMALQQYYNSSISNIGPHEGVYMNYADQDFLTQVTAIIESNIDNDKLNPTFLCHELALSRMQFYRKIKELTNSSPSCFIRNVRLKRSAKMLKTESMTIQEIMYAVGFNSKSYYYKEFTLYYGVSPKVYRSTNITNSTTC